MVRKKLTDKEIKQAQKLLLKGITPPELAEKYGVSRSVIYRRVKDPLCAEEIPIEIKKQVVKAIKQGHTKAEAAEMFGLNIGTVYNFCRDLGVVGHRSQGSHIIRKNGIKLLNRLMTDGYLISDFTVPVVRNLQMKLPIIRSARYKDKTFFYLPGKEEETIEAFFREKPDRKISYVSIEEISYLLGVKFSKKSALTLVRKYKGKHSQYWRSRMLVQRSLLEWCDDNPFNSGVEDSYRLMPRKDGEW